MKRQILQSLFVSGESTRLIEVANSEQNAELRRRAVQHLGTMGRTKTGDALVGIYAKEKEIDIKRYGDQRAVHRRTTPSRWSPSPARKPIRR